MNSDNLRLIFDLKNELNVLRNSNYTLSVNNSALTSRIKSTETKYEKLQSDYKDLKNNIETIVAKAVDEAVAKVNSSFNETMAEKDIQIKKLEKEIERLKSQINKNSSNSSKPSSSNGFKKVIQNNREKTSKRMGGQIGHNPHKLELPNNIEELINKGLLERRIKYYKAEKDAILSSEYITKYELELEIKTLLIEHRFYKEINQLTNEVINPSIPEHLNNKVNYGLGFKTLSVLLSNEGLIANNRLKDFFAGITNGIINPSTATIIANNRLFARKLDKSGQLEVIKNNILNGECLHVDDTGRGTTQILEDDKREREDRKVFQSCIRTYSNELNTFYTFNSRKNNEGLKNDDILTRYHGNIIHDHESKFRKYGTEGKHGNCHSHCNRELKGIFENLKVKFSMELRNFFNGLNSEKKELITLNIKKMSSQKLNEIDEKYDDIIRKGQEEIKPLTEKFGYKDAFNMLVRMEEYKDMYLLFVRDFRVSYTNNLAERDLRHASLHENISGVLRSYGGGQTYVKNRSFISTIKKRKLNIYEAIKKIMNDGKVLKVGE